jgi:hypothetical protein
MSSTHRIYPPVTWRRIERSPDGWTVGISFVALSVSVFTFVDSEWHARQEAREQSAYNTCITYTAGDASGLGQLPHLGVNTPAVGRDAGIAVFHAAIMAVTSAKEKRFLFSILISLHKS